MEYVRILHLAASTMESAVESVLTDLLASGDTFDYLKVKDLASPRPTSVPKLSVPQVDLAQYDRMLGRLA